MSFTKKQRSRRQPTELHPGMEGTQGRTRVFRQRRKKLGFSLFCALVVLALAGLGAPSLSGSLPSAATEEPVATVDAPLPGAAPHR